MKLVSSMRQEDGIEMRRATKLSTVLTGVLLAFLGIAQQHGVAATIRSQPVDLVLLGKVLIEGTIQPGDDRIFESVIGSMQFKEGVVELSSSGGDVETACRIGR